MGGRVCRPFRNYSNGSVRRKPVLRFRFPLHLLSKKRSRTFLPDFKLQPDALKFLVSVLGGVSRNGFNCLNNSCSNFVWIGSRVRSSVFQPTFPSILNSRN